MFGSPHFRARISYHWRPVSEEIRFLQCYFNVWSGLEISSKIEMKSGGIASPILNSQHFAGLRRKCLRAGGVLHQIHTFIKIRVRQFSADSGIAGVGSEDPGLPFHIGFRDTGVAQGKELLRCFRADIQLSGLKRSPARHGKDYRSNGVAAGDRRRSSAMGRCGLSEIRLILKNAEVIRSENTGESGGMPGSRLHRSKLTANS
jgi:hypothetical protein